jgi:hypothetical protein
MFQAFKKFESEIFLWFSSGVFTTYPHGSKFQAWQKYRIDTYEDHGIKYQEYRALFYEGH